MSSPANNNPQPIQPTTSGSMNAGAKQQSVQPLRSTAQDHANQSTSSQRQHRGRGGRSAYRGTNSRQAISKNQHDGSPSSTAAAASTLAGDPDSGSTSQRSVPQSPVGDPTTASNVNKARSGQRGFRGAGGGGGSSGKYRQRQQLNQLIDGLDGLDIDLVESLAPTNRPNDSGKGRHATVTRKVNLTHLLNYDRRQRGGGRQRGFYNDQRVNHQQHHQNYYRDCNNVHKFNKQQFLQANCQFVVLPFHDYTVHKVDPDWPVDWDCIEEVKFKQTGATETTCPICLDPPVSAKITKCGHIYCWTCMLHYLSLSDERSRQCPICFEPILESDLRSVVSCLYSDHAIDEEITMRLMFRSKGCVEIEPYPGMDHMSGQVLRAEVGEHYGSQANLLIVSPSIVVAEVANRERDELQFKLETDHDEPEVCFVEQALVKLNQRIERLQQLSNEPPKLVSKEPQDSRHVMVPSTSQKEEKSFLFYQSTDGQHIYLNPFSTRILCHEYGSLENCPLEIRAKVLQMDWISMNESWRKRFKYLEHLPLTCEFRLIEIDFESSNLVSPDTFALFADQIKARANERAFRKTEELKRDKIIQIEQNRKIYGIQPSLTINLDNMEQFPSVFEDSRNEQVKSPSQVEGDSNQTEQASPEPVTHVEDEFPPGKTLSFKEIQERQEAAEAAEAAKSSTKVQAKNSWPGSRPTAKGGPQSSFAKLLVDAKSSSKQWTRTVNPASAKQSNVTQPGTSQQRQQVATGASFEPDGDDGGEELRAPPGGFTIGDMLERLPKRSRKRS